MEEKYIPLETQSQANTPATPSEPEGSKGKGKPTLTTCTGKITIINPVVTSKETLASKGIKQRTEKAFPEAADLEEDTLDAVVVGKTLREIIPTLLFIFQFNRDLKPEDWKVMNQLLQLHQLLKDLFKWSMDNKRFNLASHCAELGESFQKICLKEIDFSNLMVITKGWNPTRKFRLLEVREKRIRENQATIQAIEEQLIHTWNTKIPSGSQGEGQISSPGASHHSETNRSVAKSQNSSQSQEVSRRRQGYKGKKRPHSARGRRVRPNDPESVGFGERSAPEPELVVNNSRSSSPINRNITPTQIEHNVVTPESNLNSNALWLQMSQFCEKTQSRLQNSKQAMTG
ncbi:hypothetical protein O181_060103 [Austropuccinia psidii MF-1]|uniref:Uncharacterized protein n=1 Tax=Austropuccinia psidii MF-1 TaxID=1389203 RepID=A0A9Q3HX74_9BASI|nr:hypothetical protein [Austropuccinia psidii MF-1]